MKRIITLMMALMMVASMFAGCAKKETTDQMTTVETQSATEESTATSDTATTEEVAPAAEINGEITVLTNRTDLVDTVMADYAKKFNEKYPNVKVKFEAMTDYEGQVKIRMNTSDYGDVLLMPNNVPATEFANFFLPLGSVDELSAKYNNVEEKAFGGQVYGIATSINVNGIVYNKKVFAAAGITTLPTTPEEFITDLQLVKDKTEAIPLYTNYAAGWPLGGQWEGFRTSVSGDKDYVNTLIHQDEPFAMDQPHYIVYKLMYDVAKNKLIEEDPLTTDWESSKTWLAEGKIATMVLGSWAISQIQAVATEPNDIGYMPFPYTKDGKMYTAAAGDYKIAISSNSKNPEAARAWIDWYLDESNFAFEQGGIGALKTSEFPETLKAFEEMGIEFVTDTPAPEAEAGLLDQVDNTAEVGLFNPDFKQRIIEAALGFKAESFDDIMIDLNSKWAAARKELAIQ